MKCIVNKLFIGALFLLSTLVCSCQTTTENTVESSVEGKDTLGFKYIDIVHITHTDYGYTDHALIAVDLHKRFIDVALDLALKTKDEIPENRFAWTVEALDPFYSWWNSASEDRRESMLDMIENKQIGINAMPFHIHPYANKEQWDEMFDWIPKDMWSQLDIEVGMQHDVNGFPRAAATRLLDRDIHYIWTGINPHWGGSPVEQPGAFWWKMPDDRKLLVWSGYPYWQGYLFFAEKEWRLQQREYANTQTSWPRNGNILQTDDVSMHGAYDVCVKRLKDLREKGYDYPFLTLTFTNEWRCDNDGPMPQLLAFIKKWNEMGFKPMLRMKTAGEAMRNIEKEIGNQLRTFEGEWQDWWAFGGAAMPREMEVARRAVYHTKAISSPVWGELNSGAKDELKEINRLLCRYFEHTYGSNETSEAPYSLYTQGQLNEKNGFAYRPWERGKYLLAQLARNKFAQADAGLYVVNAANASYTGWVKLDVTGFREVDYKSVRNLETGKSYPLFKEGDYVWRWVVDENLNTSREAIPGGTEAWFWVSDMPANSFTRFALDTSEVEIIDKKIDLPELSFDNNGWVTSARWKGMDEPLFTEGLADFMVVHFNDMDRWSQGDIYMHMDEAQRIEKFNEITRMEWAKPKSKAKVRETPYSWIVSQDMEHPRVKNMNRQVEIFKEVPRAKVNIFFDRISSIAPEVFYAKFPFPQDCRQPVATNGGIPYELYKEQIPNSCKDFFVIDSWVKYEAEDGARIWSSGDVPIVSFGGHHMGMRLQDAPKKENELYGMLYNNLWVVNFCVDSPGEMNFEFDLTYREGKQSVEQLTDMADSYYIPMSIVNTPEAPEDPVVHKYLNTPQRLTSEY